MSYVYERILCKTGETLGFVTAQLLREQEHHKTSSYIGFYIEVDQPPYDFSQTRGTGLYRIQTCRLSKGFSPYRTGFCTPFHITRQHVLQVSLVTKSKTELYAGRYQTAQCGQ
jgi:hypothetical protein